MYGACYIEAVPGNVVQKAGGIQAEYSRKTTNKQKEKPVNSKGGKSHEISERQISDRRLLLRRHALRGQIHERRNRHGN